MQAKVTRLGAKFAFWCRPSVVFCAIFLLLPGRPGWAQLSHIEAASRLLSQGRAEDAEREARLAMGQTTTRPLAYSMLGTIRLQQGKYRESVQLLKQALALNPRLPGTWTTLGGAYALENKPDLARRSFERALALDAANDNARFDLAKLDASQGYYRKSLETARPMLDALRKSDEGLMLLATDYGALGEKNALAETFRDWNGLQDPSDEASLQFGQVLVKSGMSTEGKSLFESVESRNSGQIKPALALNLASGYFELGDTDRAGKNFQKALALNPACAACNAGLAAVAERQGNSEQALAYLVKAKNQAPDDPEILFEFGKACLERNLIQDALPALAKAVSLAPDRDNYVYVYGSANVGRGDLPKAAAIFGGLLQKHPGDPVLIYAMGTVYYLQGKYADAQALLERCLKARPGQVGAAYYLSLTYSHLGRNDQAEQLLRGLAKSHPDYAPAYVRLGTMLVAERQFPEARQDLERAIALDPSSVQAHYQLYLLSRQSGDKTESDKYFAEWQKLKSEQGAEKHLELHLLLPN